MVSDRQSCSLPVRVEWDYIGYGFADTAPVFSVLPAMDIVPSNPHGVSSPSEKHRHSLREARLKSDKSNSAGLAFTLRCVCLEGFLCNEQKVPGFTWDRSHSQLQ